MGDDKFHLLLESQPQAMKSLATPLGSTAEAGSGLHDNEEQHSLAPISTEESLPPGTEG